MVRLLHCRPLPQEGHMLQPCTLKITKSMRLRDASSPAAA